MSDRKNQFVLTATPLRLSFAGGGSDFKNFYELHEGAIVSSCINKEIFVTVKRHNKIFNEKFRLNYSSSEIVNEVKEIRNDIARECIKLVGINYPIYISTIADLPEKSGLGSSSSFCVGLLRALFELEGKIISNEELLKYSIEIELDILKRPMGIQDQLAAVYGGLNFFKIKNDGSVEIIESKISDSKISSKIFDKLILFWTSIQRDSSDILSEQESNIKNNFDNLIFLKNQCIDLWELLNTDFTSHQLGNLIEAGWERKVQLASKISNPKILDMYDRCKLSGADGGKLSGAGGGGFFLIICDESRRDNIITEMSDYQKIDIDFNPLGSRVLISR